MVENDYLEIAGRRFRSRLIIGTGCVTPITAPTANIRAARQAVEEMHAASD